MYKIIFTDLDGTLLPESKRISDYSKNIIAKVRKLGIPFILASGRSISNMRRFQKDLNLNEPLISYNGALIDINNKNYYYKPLELSIAMKLLEFSIKKRCYFQFYDEDQLTTLLSYRDHPNLMHYVKNTDLTPFYTQLENINLNSVTKWMFIENDRLKLESLASEIRESFGLDTSMSFTSSIYFEIYNKEVNKGNAALKVVDWYGLKPSDIISFGDNYNDVELINISKLGVVMGNAPKDIRSIADRVTSYTCEEDAVAKILDEIFFLS